MNIVQTVILGAIAGFTIYIGLPICRIERVSERIRAFLTMTSVGILFFLLFDVLSNVQAPIKEVLNDVLGGKAAVDDFALLVGIFVLGLSIGLLSLIAFESRFMRKSSEPTAALSPARLAMMIATGLGLHNFSEGLAIGQSAAGGQIALAGLLIVGFGLHNATEGFGIVGPLAGTKPSWTFLGLVGMIGGGPTFIGTVVGYSFVSTPLSVLFLSLAAGAILFVIGELYGVARRPGVKSTAMLGLLVGFFIAYGTDLVLKIAGA